MKKTNHMSKGAKVAIGTGLATLAAVAAGTYFLYGSKGAKKNRRQVKSWALKAKAEVLEQLESLSEVNEEIYHRIVKEVTSRYQALKHLDPKDVMDLASELKAHWKDIAEEIGIHKTAKPAKRAAKSTKK